MDFRNKDMTFKISEIGHLDVSLKIFEKKSFLVSEMSSNEEPE